MKVEQKEVFDVVLKQGTTYRRFAVIADSMKEALDIASTYVYEKAFANYVLDNIGRADYCGGLVETRVLHSTKGEEDASGYSVCRVCGELYGELFVIPAEVYEKVKEYEEEPGDGYCLRCVNKLMKEVGIKKYWVTEDDIYVE